MNLRRISAGAVLGAAFAWGVVAAGCESPRDPEFVNILVPEAPVPDCNFDGNDPPECVARCDEMDSDGDGIKDARDPDVDGDGVPNADDNCPLAPNALQADADGDGAGDSCDNCPDVPNSAQEDWNFDGAGDACQDGGVALGGVVRNFGGPLAWLAALAVPFAYLQGLRGRIRVRTR